MLQVMWLIFIILFMVIGSVSAFVSLKDSSMFWAIVSSVLVVLGSAMTPGITLRIIRKKRAKMFVYQLPDCLGSIAGALRGGANLTRALELVAKQQPAPMSQEFIMVLAENKVGRDLEESLDDLYKRIQKQELNLMNSAITISRSVGGNLADTLDSLAETLRETAEMEGKVEALTSMGKMQAWVIGCIPFLVAMVMLKKEPEGMMALVTTPVGWAVCGLIATMLTIAAVMIKKIINVDI